MRKETPDRFAQNRRAFHDYLIEQKFEAGLVLIGCEVKSIRQGNVNLKDSYAHIKNGELWLQACYISPFKEGNRFNEDPVRSRKLLMHKKEIKRLADKLARQPLNLIPIAIYLKKNKIKVSLGLGRSKKQIDKRHSLKERQVKKDIDRQIKARY
eukprot:COSAG01_NODE_6_length_54687_cov_500.907599_7_plen_154_part_00